jgi:glycerate-2-kinase
MKIQNFAELAVTPAREKLLRIADAGLAAIDTGAVIRDAIRRDGDTIRIGNEEIAPGSVDHIIFIAVGKCAADAANAAAAIIGDRIARGIVVDVKESPAILNFQIFRGTHPLPSDENLAATEAIMAALAGLTERDLVIFVVSGGGSTLLFLPQQRDDREEIAIWNALTDVGATIEELNTVRKHLSLARGGGLARAAYPARVLSLIFSDVPGDDLGFIASGPTVKDATTVQDAEAILAKFDVLKICKIEKCDLIETPKEEQYFSRVINMLVVSNRRALEAMRDTAVELGLKPEIRSATLAGDAAATATMITDELHHSLSGTALLWGGETTVRIKGNGKGGRNLQLAATALDLIADDEELLSFDSDGRDHGFYAGAICDRMTAQAVADAGLDLAKFRDENNTEALFQKVGHFVLTGDTGSNVSDLIVAIKE